MNWTHISLENCPVNLCSVERNEYSIEYENVYKYVMQGRTDRE